jgi:hypothetical protein
MFSSNLDRMAFSDNNLDKQILWFMYDFGNDKVSRRPWVSPLIPMCWLVSKELVRLTQKHGEGVETLEESFWNKRSTRRMGRRFYVQPRDRDGEWLVITEEEKAGWDDCGRSKTRTLSESVRKSQNLSGW